MIGTDAMRIRLRLAAILAGLAMLSGCAGLGGNIKGSFACSAPDGICAPSAVIDDRALATISGYPSGEPISAGPLQEHGVNALAPRSAVAEPIGVPLGANAARSRERVMRIVFPAYVDGRGRLHEASAIHAVVAEGEWQSAAGAGEQAPARNALAAAPQMPSLAETVDQAEGAQAVDPTLPTPVGVEAARARKADPVATIKADVARHLAATRRDARAAAGANARRQAGGTPLSAREGAGTAVPDAQPTFAPSLAAPPTSTMHAAAFPGAVAEDQ